jgi:hypothetical protein
MSRIVRLNPVTRWANTRNEIEATDDGKTWCYLGELISAKLPRRVGTPSSAEA